MEDEHRYGVFGPLPEAHPPPAPETEPAQRSAPCQPKPERHYLKRTLGWAAIVLSLLWVIPAMTISLKELNVGRSPVPGVVVKAEQHRTRQFERCTLTVEVDQDNHPRRYVYDSEAPCRQLQKPGEPLTVYLPSNGGDKHVAIEGQERQDRVGGYVATVVVPFCPLLVVALPAARYLIRERRKRITQQRRGACLG